MRESSECNTCILDILNKRLSRTHLFYRETAATRVTRYFGGLNQLTEAYVVENDYWLLFIERINDLLKSNNYPGSKELITSVLQNQFTYFSSEKDMQRLILYELTT